MVIYELLNIHHQQDLVSYTSKIKILDYEWMKLVLFIHKKKQANIMHETDTKGLNRENFVHFEHSMTFSI